MPCQRLPSKRPDTVQFIGEDDSLPLVEAEMTDDSLLPVGLIGRGDIGKAVRCGDRRFQAFAARDV